MRFFREWVLNNWPLKLLALALSFLLWTAYTSEPIVEIGYQVPIEFVGVPRNLEISGDPAAIAYVRLRGRSALLRRISAADVDIHADLSHAQEGKNVITLDARAVQAPYGAQVVHLSPSELHVVLTPRHTLPPAP